MERANRTQTNERPDNGPIEAINFDYDSGEPLMAVYVEALAVTAATRNVRPAVGWSAAASCWEHDDPGIFFPEIFYPDDEAKWAEAAAICGDCPVRTDCLEAGMDQRFGLWGGLSWEIRKEIAWQRAVATNGDSPIPEAPEHRRQGPAVPGKRSGSGPS